MEKKIAFATNSEHKLKEVKSLLSPLGLLVVSPKDLGISFSPEETESTFLGNSLIKSKELYRLSGLPSVADDSGICVEALGGKPGVYSARYGKPEFSDKDRALYLLNELAQNKNRNANYTCVITYVTANEEKVFEGVVHGEIAQDYDEEGPYGFGYDPIFFYPPFGKRFSRLPLLEKNKISHRAVAMNQFLQWIQK